MPIPHKKPRKIKALKVNEISLVDAGANPGAQISLLKRKTPATQTPEYKSALEAIKSAEQEFISKRDAMTTDEILEYREAMDEWYNIHSAFMQSVESIMYADDGIDTSKLAKTIEEFVVAVKGIVPKLKVGKGASEMDITKLSKEAQDFIKGLQEQIATLTEKVNNPTTPPKAEPTEEDLLKTLPKSFVERLTKAEERATAAEAAAQVEKDARLLETFVKRAGTEFANLPGTPEEKGKILKSVHLKLVKEEVDALEALLKAGEEAFKQSGILRQLGGNDPTPTGSALQKIEVKAAEIAKTLAITKEAAFAHVCANDPALYEEYKKEQRQRLN